MHRVILTMLGVASAACLGVSLLGSLGRWHWYADLFNHFRPQYLAVASLLGVLSLFTRVRRFQMLSIAALFVNLLEMAPHLLPENRPPRLDGQPPGPSLKLATINVLRTNRQFDSVVLLLRERRPDVVVLQEMDGAWEAALLPLKDIYPHQFSKWNRTGYFGLGVLSRFPLHEAGLIELGTPGQRGLQMSLDFRNRRIAILNLHAPHPTSAPKVENVKRMHEALRDWALTQRAAGVPAVIAGDFNLTPWSFLYRRGLTMPGMEDSSRGRVFEATRNVCFPNRLLIDHAFASEDWLLRSREVGGSIGSDHRPVFVEWELAR